MGVNKPLKWHEKIFLGVISLGLSLCITFRGFSMLIGDRSYSELGSSKTSGIAYAIGKLELTNWRFLLVGIFALIGIILIKEGNQMYRRIRNKKEE